MKQVTLTTGQALAVYGLLVEYCDAPTSQIDSFITSLTTEKERHEYRFQGNLGFGGKFEMRHNLSRGLLSGEYLIT